MELPLLLAQTSMGQLRHDLTGIVIGQDGLVGLTGEVALEAADHVAMDRPLAVRRET